jgi:hypothetical protein
MRSRNRRMVQRFGAEHSLAAVLLSAGLAPPEAKLYLTKREQAAQDRSLRLAWFSSAGACGRARQARPIK